MNLHYAFILAMLFLRFSFGDQIRIGSSQTNEQKIRNKQNKTYYVSEEGDDNNLGTISNPFRTIEKASSVLYAGDSCIIMEGVYRETLKPHRHGTPDKPIVFMAKPGDKVTLSAMEKLDGVIKQNGISEFNVKFDLKEENLVLCNGEPLTLARWPNKCNNNLMDPEATEITAKGSSPIGIIANNFPTDFTGRNLTGATVWVNADRKWSCWTNHVTGYNSSEKKISLEGFGENWWVNERHNPGNVHIYGPGMFFIANAEILLDNPGEWFFNRDEKKLKLILPENCSGSPIIEMKKRKWTIELNGTSCIVVNGIECIGAPVTIKDANNCAITNSKIKYFGLPFGYNSPQGIGEINGNILAGVKNTIQSCEIVGSSGNGLRISGNENKVVNCDIHDINYLGSHAVAPLSLTGGGHIIAYNSIHNAGRDCVRLGGGGHIIAYNHIYNPGRISEDLGVLKSGGTDADNMVIHHNIISNDNGKFIGIYFDNYTNNIIAHHNIVTGMQDGIRCNRPGHFHIIYNNSVSPDINNKFGPWNGTADQFGSVIVNNLTEKAILANKEVNAGQNQIVSMDSLKSEYDVKNNKFADFPDYLGAIEPGNLPFKAGHDFKNPPELKFANSLPFVRNHLINGCFDYSRTYAETSIRDDELLLKYWEKTFSKQAEVQYFKGFNFPINPEERFSIHGNSLCLRGSKTDGVSQTIKTLLPNRQYILSAYVKQNDSTNVQFSITVNGKIVGIISTNQIENSPCSNWKFVKLNFELKNHYKEVNLNISKIGNGDAFIDDVGIIPFPLILN